MSPPPPPPRIDVEGLLARYDALLFDAYGVLVSSSGALPGAAELIARLERERRPYLVVSNDASRTPAACARFYASTGLEIPAERVLTSGGLLAGFFAERGFAGARCVVLGPTPSHEMVRDAGGVLVAAREPFDVLVVADEAGFPFLDTVDEVISALFRAAAEGRVPTLLLPNPDLLYPKGAGELTAARRRRAHGQGAPGSPPASGGEFGVAAGGIALLVEAALAHRLQGAAPRFVRLGKPERPLFDEARRRLPGSSLVMLGDQLETDVAGALAAGINAALVETGVDRWREGAAVTPTWLVAGLA